MALMEAVWPAAIARVAEEVADMQAVAWPKGVFWVFGTGKPCNKQALMSKKGIISIDFLKDNNFWFQLNKRARCIIFKVCLYFVRLIVFKCYNNNVLI